MQAQQIPPQSCLLSPLCISSSCPTHLSLFLWGVFSLGPSLRCPQLLPSSLPSFLSSSCFLPSTPPSLRSLTSCPVNIHSQSRKSCPHLPPHLLHFTHIMPPSFSDIYYNLKLIKQSMSTSSYDMHYPMCWLCISAQMGFGMKRKSSRGKKARRNQMHKSFTEADTSQNQRHNSNSKLKIQSLTKTDIDALPLHRRGIVSYTFFFFFLNVITPD